MSDNATCPICTMSDIAESGEGFECSTCGHEWVATVGDEQLIVKDSNGNLLADGDSVTLIKDLKVKGAGNTMKSGTKVKGIRLVSGDHEIDAKVEGRGVLIKAMFVKKA